jgi:hypothetical protein
MRTPDQKGQAAEAWIIDPSQFPPSPASICLWLVVSKIFHPIWDSWIVQAIHLREIDGAQPPVLRYPEAEHEIMILSLSHDHGVYDPDKMPFPVPYLTPIDMVKQVDGYSDGQVAQLVGRMIAEIVAGRMSPDSDYRSQWEKVIDHDIACYKSGRRGQS